MLFLITGASGSGKSTCLQLLRAQLPQVTWHDFDDLGVPAGADKTWRHRTMEVWVQKALELEHEGRDMGLCGQAPYGEALAAPSAEHLDAVIGVLLDVHDVHRVERLHARGSPELATQDMLSWSAWHRMHAVDPQWRQDVIREGSDAPMCWSRWQSWRRGDPRWRVSTLDTSGSSVSETVALIVRRYERERSKRG